MKSTRIRAWVVIAVAMAVVVSACGTGGHPPADAPLVVRIGTFVTNASPRRPVAVLAGILAAEPLVSVAWDGRPVFRLAESGRESEDGRTVTLALRPGVRFHTGEPVTAGRVRELLLPQLLARADGVADVEARDEATLVIHLRRAHSFKLIDLSDFIIDDDRRPELRTGPFKVVAVEPAAVLEPFAEYHQGAPSITRIEIREYPTHRAAWTAMMRGEVNFLHEISREAIDFSRAGGDIRTYPLLRPYYSVLVFSQKHPILRRREVRIALNEAVNRDEVVRNGMRGHGEVAGGPFWPHHWAYPTGWHATAYNPEAAAVRLESAGLPVRAQAERAMPSRFAFTCLLREGDTRFERIALVLQRQLFAAGVDMRLHAVPDAEFFERLRSGEFDAFLFEMMGGRTLGPAYAFWRSPADGAQGRLGAGYAAADAALDRLKFAKTDDETRAAVADVMRVMREDPPAVFLAWPREARAADASLEIPYEPDRDVFGVLWQARAAPALLARSQ